ncbi:hypothetical protein LC612_20400 [Nostoc sp. CHAB 5834]|nr:hypothetical protein [Nostoc sp. CHAB 5834]
MIHPKRAERHWLAIAIAILWQVSVGGAVDRRQFLLGAGEKVQTLPLVGKSPLAPFLPWLRATTASGVVFLPS